MAKAQGAWRRAVAKAVQKGIPVPAMSSALAFYDGYRREALPRTCSRRNAITSVRTLTSAWTSRAASTSTPTGRARRRRHVDRLEEGLGGPVRARGMRERRASACPSPVFFPVWIRDPRPELIGKLKNSFVPRLLKKGQLQGAVTHLRWVPGVAT